MELVVAALRPTPILWRRASGPASPMEVPASTLPARGMAPVRANIASRSVVLPLWKGPTSAMHRGPRGLLTSCPIAASSSGARPLIGSASLMLRPSRRFGKRENVAAMHRGVHTAVILRLAEDGEHLPGERNCVHPGDDGSACFLTSRPEFQAFQPGRDVDADLALQAERLQGDRIVGTADQHVAADTDAEPRAA